MLVFIEIYRERLRREAGAPIFFVYLEGSKELLMRRMAARTGHFMPPSLLESQLQTLEVPSGEPAVVTVDIDDTLDGIVDSAISQLSALTDLM